MTVLTLKVPGFTVSGLGFDAVDLLIYTVEADVDAIRSNSMLMSMA